jgi:hypothetical protein
VFASQGVIRQGSLAEESQIVLAPSKWSPAIRGVSTFTPFRLLALFQSRECSETTALRSTGSAKSDRSKVPWLMICKTGIQNVPFTCKHHIRSLLVRQTL